MQLSKLGQGLAVSAVGALLVTGLAVASPAGAADGPGVRLLSQEHHQASVRRDAGSSAGLTVSLAAQVLDPGATISFEYNADPAAGDTSDGWTPATGATTRLGAYLGMEWVPDQSLVGTSIAIRAVATVVTDTTTTATYSTRNDVALAGASSPVHAVSIGASLDGFPIGFPFPIMTGTSNGAYFEQPYASTGRTAHLLTVVGSTSATEGSVELSAWNPSAGAFQGTTAAAVDRSSFKVSNGGPGSYVDGGSFTGSLDIAGFDARGGDVLAVRAERDSDAVVPVRLVAQTIAGIQPQVQPRASDTLVTLSVLAQGSLVAVNGAEVRRSSDGSLVGYTDARGTVSESLPYGTSTDGYYVNTTDVDAFEQGTDVRTGPITTPAYVPTAAATAAVLADGPAFDDREYADGDIALQVVDGLGDAYAGEEDLSWTLTGPDGVEHAGAGTTDADGRLAVDFDPAWPDGAYTLAFTAPDSVGGADEETVTFVAGDAVLGLTPLAGRAAPGGRITYAGTLTVAGRPLAGRDIDLAYTRGTEQAPGTAADATLLLGDMRKLDGRGTIATAADGTFTVVVADVTELGDPAETGGRLKVTATSTSDVADATADFVPAPAPQPTPTTAPPTGKARVVLRLTGRDAGPQRDRLRISGPTEASGQKVRIHVRTATGAWKVVDTVTLGTTGDATVTLDDTNGRAATWYRVRLVPNAATFAYTSAARKLR